MLYKTQVQPECIPGARSLLHHTMKPKQAGLAVSSTLATYSTCRTELPNPTLKYNGNVRFCPYDLEKLR
jgi:hypothetical protein